MGLFQKTTPGRGRLHLLLDDRVENRVAAIDEDLPPPRRVPAGSTELLCPRTSAQAAPVSVSPRSPVEEKVGPFLGRQEAAPLPALVPEEKPGPSLQPHKP